MPVPSTVTPVPASAAKTVPVSVRPLPALYTAVEATCVNVILVVPKVIVPSVFITYSSPAPALPSSTKNASPLPKELGSEGA